METSQILSFLTVIVLIQFGLNTAQPTYRDHNCDIGGNYTNGSPYQSNLNLLLSSFSSTNFTELDDGFSNTTIGSNPDRVYGLFLCRGDVTTEICRNCVQTATQDIKQVCPNKKEAIMWYDECILRYSNQTIFPIMQKLPYGFWWSRENISDPNKFNPTIEDMLERLRGRAPFNSSKISTEEVNFTSSERIYGLVQCTPDLSANDCQECLYTVNAEFPSCCAGRKAANVFVPSCFFRYEVLSISIPPLPPSTGTTPTNGKGKKTSNIVLIVVIPLVIALILSVIVVWLCSRRKKSYEQIDDTDEIMRIESLRFNFRTICAATDNFSDTNKLGEGGFGSVYKGKLSGGQEIAVKRLSINSGQGEKEFKNEVGLLAKLQHRNLVKLLGFSFDGSEKLLIYEFVSNGSLDHFIFDAVKRANLNWETRCKIIGGIARGLLYLHEDSRLRIIHRDLKASNVLLDSEMNPKISDFGMAKLIVVDQTRGRTTQVVGTYGYMAPEYLLHGQFSGKSDVYSFGVLLLEIITGQRINHFESEHAEYLLTYVWRNWEDKTTIKLIDQTIRDDFPESEVMRYIQIGLLSVQDVTERPNIASVALMLTTDAITLPLPSPPALFNRNRMEPTEDNTSSRVTGSDTYTSNSSKPWSTNEVSITDMHPR